MLRFESTASTSTRRAWCRRSVAGLGLVALLACSLLALPAFAHDDGDAYALDFTKAPRNVLPWGQLAKVGIERSGGKIRVEFLPPVLALDRRQVTLYGYMTPVKAGATHKQFLLSMQPLMCPGCTTPTTPDGIVEVNVRRAEPTRAGPLAVRGTLELVKNDPHGLIYRLANGKVVARTAGARPGS